MSSEILGKAPPPPPPVLCWMGFIVHVTAGAGRSKPNASLLRVETPPRAQILWTNKMSKTLLSVRFVLVALPEAEPAAPRGRGRPPYEAAGSGARGLRAGEGARPTEG